MIRPRNRRWPRYVTRVGHLHNASAVRARHKHTGPNVGHRRTFCSSIGSARRVACDDVNTQCTCNTRERKPATHPLPCSWARHMPRARTLLTFCTHHDHTRSCDFPASVHLHTRQRTPCAHAFTSNATDHGYSSAQLTSCASQTSQPTPSYARAAGVCGGGGLRISNTENDGSGQYRDKRDRPASGYMHDTSTAARPRRRTNQLCRSHDRT